MRGIVALLLAGSIAVSVLGGCGPAHGDAYLSSFRAGQRAYNAGRYDQAAALFAQAGVDAERLKDRDEAYFMQARMHERAERWKDAQQVYARIMQFTPPGARQKRASYEYAELEIAHGDADHGWALLAETIQRYPDHGSTKRGIQRWTLHTAETHSEAAARTALAQWLTTLGDTAASQQLKYEIGLSLMRDGLLTEAHAQLLVTARQHPYPLGALTDDALLWASKIAEQKGDYQQAVQDIEELLGGRESALGGSYERPLFPQAQFRLALLYRDRLNDVPGARRELRRMVNQHNTSVLADDALWHGARIALSLGDVDDACSIAGELRDRMPRSRYRRCLPQLCAQAEPVEPRPCPDYLLRELQGGSNPPSPMRDGMAPSFEDPARGFEPGAAETP